MINNYSCYHLLVVSFYVFFRNLFFFSYLLVHLIHLLKTSCMARQCRGKKIEKKYFEFFIHECPHFSLIGPAATYLWMSCFIIQGVPKTWEFSDEFDIVFAWISIVIPNFKTQNIIMSARVYLMKTVNDCKDVFIISPQDEQWRRTSLLCLYTVIFLFY